MNESDFENVIIKHPELIEEGLIFLERQKNLEGKYLDLLFQDKNGQKVIVELKLIAKRKDIAQLIDYAGYFIDDLGAPIRAILVANRIPPNFRKSLEYFGIEYNEIPDSRISEYIPNNVKPEIKIPVNDSEFKSQDEIQTNRLDKNVTRQSMANKFKKGKLSRHARVAFLLLKDNPNKIFTMKEITDYMKSNGYKSRSYYDLFNALMDADLVKCISIQGKKKKAYKINE